MALNKILSWLNSGQKCVVKETVRVRILRDDGSGQKPFSDEVIKDFPLRMTLGEFEVEIIPDNDDSFSSCQPFGNSA